LFREKSTADCLLVAGLLREKSTAGWWWLISQMNGPKMVARPTTADWTGPWSGPARARGKAWSQDSNTFSSRLYIPTQVKASASLPHSPAPRRVRFDPSSSTGDLRQGPAKSAYQWQVRPAPSGVRPQWRPPTT
jgi:hypothetical protein